MKILVVDDSATVRAMLRRALQDLSTVEVAEATNGLEALTEIARHRFDLVILDVNMPAMNGLDVLEAIRSSPAHTALPVVVLTSERSDTVVRRLVELGLTDYLSKPLSYSSLAERLATIIGRLRLPTAGPRPHHASTAHPSVLVVDLDPDRRHFATTVLAPHYQIATADTAASALYACLDPQTRRPDLVLIGEQVGLPPLAMFVAKLREIPLTAEARIVGVRARTAGGTDGARDLFDDTLEWTYVPEIFLARFEKAARGTTHAGTPMAAFRSTLERDAQSATQQLFGLMLSSDVTPVAPGSAPVRPWPGAGVHARIDLRADDGSTLSVLFRADRDSARAVTARLLGTAEGEVLDDDIAATAGEFANIIGGRLRNRMFEAGIPTAMQLPRTWFGSGPPDCETPDVSLESDLRGLQASFGVILRVGEDAGGVSAPTVKLRGGAFV